MSERNIKEWLQEHRDEMVADLTRLVNIPSVSADSNDPEAPFGKACRTVLHTALGLGQRHGFETENHHNMCGSILWRGCVKRELGIFGHLDVVPAGDGWIYDPFQARVTDDIVIGRGSDDDKGSVMAVFYALRYLKENGYEPKCSIRLFLGIDEEKDMNDIRYYTQHYREPDFSFVPDIQFPVCIGEKGILRVNAEYTVESKVLLALKSGMVVNQVPGQAKATLHLNDDALQALNRYLKANAPDSRMEPCMNEKGISDEYVLTVFGIPKHSAFPEGSVNAEVKMAQILTGAHILDEPAEKLMQSIRVLFGDTYGEGLNIACEDKVSGKLTHVGNMASLSSAKMRQTIDIRYCVSADPEQIIQKLTEKMTGWGWKIAGIKDNRPYYCNPDREEIQTLLGVCDEYLPGEQKPFVIGGGTYARKLHNAVGFGASFGKVKNRFGTGHGNAHQADEYVEIQDLQRAAQIYAAAIQALDRVMGK